MPESAYMVTGSTV